MRYRYISLLILSVLVSTAYAAPQDAIDSETMISEDSQTAVEPSDVDLDEEDNDEDETSGMSEIQAKLFRAQQEEKQAAAMTTYSEDDASTLAPAQKEKLAAENQPIEIKPAPSVVDKKTLPDKYNKTKHDWSFKNKKSQGGSLSATSY